MAYTNRGSYTHIKNFKVASKIVEASLDLKV